MQIFISEVINQVRPAFFRQLEWKKASCGDKKRSWCWHGVATVVLDVPSLQGDGGRGPRGGGSPPGPPTSREAEIQPGAEQCDVERESQATVLQALGEGQCLVGRLAGTGRRPSSSRAQAQDGAKQVRGGGEWQEPREVTQHPDQVLHLPGAPLYCLRSLSSHLHPRHSLQLSSHPPCLGKGKKWETTNITILSPQELSLNEHMYTPYDISLDSA